MNENKFTPRAEEALYPGRITDEALDLIAENAADYGDARLAIELLDRAANIAEEDSEGEVTIEHVRAAKAMIYSSVSEGRLRSLDINRMLVLLAVARAMKQNPSIPSASASPGATQGNCLWPCTESRSYGRHCPKNWKWTANTTRTVISVLGKHRST